MQGSFSEATICSKLARTMQTMERFFEAKLVHTDLWTIPLKRSRYTVRGEDFMSISITMKDADRLVVYFLEHAGRTRIAMARDEEGLGRERYFGLFAASRFLYTNLLEMGMVSCIPVAKLRAQRVLEQSKEERDRETEIRLARYRKDPVLRLRENAQRDLEAAEEQERSINRRNRGGLPLFGEISSTEFADITGQAVNGSATTRPLSSCSSVFSVAQNSIAGSISGMAYHGDRIAMMSAWNKRVSLDRDIFPNRKTADLITIASPPHGSVNSIVSLCSTAMTGMAEGRDQLVELASRPTSTAPSSTLSLKRKDVSISIPKKRPAKLPSFRNQPPQKEATEQRQASSSATTSRLHHDRDSGTIDLCEVSTPYRASSQTPMGSSSISELHGYPDLLQMSDDSDDDVLRLNIADSAKKVRQTRPSEMPCLQEVEELPERHNMESPSEPQVASSTTVEKAFVPSPFDVRVTSTV